ncbi:MAG: uroporphyrinogen-III C-methyltransferase [Comamonas sp.]|nr:uroporphyrinogen-III C-methyltransferase [Comamonas sp.]
MSADGPTIPSHAVPFDAAAPRTPTPAAPGWTWLALLLAAAGLAGSLTAWNKVQTMQERLAQQSAQANAQAQEARTLAKEAQEQVLAANARLTVAEARLADVSLQRGQLEELVHNLSRSREDTLALDLEAAMRLAVQQAQLTGSTAPLIASLKSASKRIEGAAQPSLALVQRAMERDLERLRQTQSVDTASLLTRLDEVLRQLDELPLQNGQPTTAQEALPPRHATAPRTDADAAAATAPSWWQGWQAQGRALWGSIRAEAGDLLRVSTISGPEAALLAPQEGIFLRENLKLQLLNARLAILGRQYTAAASDLGVVQASIGKYFVANARRTHSVQATLAQLQEQLRNNQQPSLDDTLTALANATARRE